MEREAFYDAVTNLLLELRPDMARPKPETHLWADGYLDSFAMVQVLAQLEEIIGREIELGPDALPSFFTLERMYDTYLTDGL